MRYGPSSNEELADCITFFAKRLDPGQRHAVAHSLAAGVCLTTDYSGSGQGERVTQEVASVMTDFGATSVQCAAFVLAISFHIA